MANEAGRFQFRERELKLLIDGEMKVTMTDDSIRTMINLLPDHYFQDIIKNYRSWLEDNGYDDITEEEFAFVTEVVNKQVKKMNDQKVAEQHNIRR